MRDILNFLTYYWYVVFPIIISLVILIIFLARKGFLRKLKIAGVELEFAGGNEKITFPRLFARSDSAEFALYFEKLIRGANHIVLIGTGINILQRDPVFLDLIDRVVREKTTLEIYLANPFSRAVEFRLVEEEIGPIKPPVGKSGLIQRLETILEKQREVGNPPNLTIKLFSHYPTFAMFILDTEYFIYPYGYALLGNFSPVSHYSKKRPEDRPMIEFLEGQYQRVKASSADAQMVFDLRAKRSANIDKVIPFAVYLIPEANTGLYRFGSEVLGYDVRENRLLASPWVASVGSAADFGFHLTVADALYFANSSEVDFLYKEIEFIAKEFRPFALTLNFQPGFPNSNSLALTCTDPSGTLEALHHELVARIYRQAVASNYSLGIMKLDRDDNLSRTEWMLNRYLAPYILQKFQPHFTLLSGLTGEWKEQTIREVEKAYRQKVTKESIEIQVLCLMRRSQSNRLWQIAEEVKLG